MTVDLLPAGLIDLDITFLVQLCLFLLFAVLARALAFGPLLRLFAQRRQQGLGALEEAAQATVRAGRLEEARQEGLDGKARELAGRLKHRREDLARQAEASLGQRREHLAGQLARRREDLAAQEARLDPELHEAASGLAAELTDRLVGRSN